jgi:hypothetical protein
VHRAVTQSFLIAIYQLNVQQTKSSIRSDQKNKDQTGIGRAGDKSMRSREYTEHKKIVFKTEIKKMLEDRQKRNGGSKENETKAAEEENPA